MFRLNSLSLSGLQFSLEERSLLLCCSVLVSLAVSVDVWFTRLLAWEPAIGGLPANGLLFVVALFVDAEPKAEDGLGGSDLLLAAAVVESIFTVVEARSG